ncbi:glucose-6-phosphate dehydrogenase [alpha proteobacterium AAP81b]|nr:glucose-6-phosphate dehydrogenase [alpha proteobacterium AAP81b]
MLIPSLYHLWREDRLAEGTRFIGAARSDLTPNEFRAQAADALTAGAATGYREPEVIADFVRRFDYLAIDADHPATIAALASRVGSSACLHYFATAPQLYGPLASALKAAGLTGDGHRVIVEKPIGHDLASSIAIDDALAAAFREEQIFRVDHYLGKETVQNLIALRFGNALFEPLWRSEGIDFVEITVAETVGLEARAGYYDGSGALRDMVQNHMLQLLALVAMEPPASLDAAAVRNEKIKVLRSLRPLTAASVASHAVAGQYGPGVADGKPARGYAEELGRASATETFAAVRADIDNWRWAGVPFYLRTGKRLASRYTEIVVHFRAVPYSIFAKDGGLLAPNKLIIRLQPEENVRLTLMAKEPGLERDGARLRELGLDLSLSEAFKDVRRRIAYERLLLDAVDGDQTLFVRRDEIEAAWEWVDSIHAGWAAAGITPRPYAAGSWGPAASIALTERFGHSWHE